MSQYAFTKHDTAQRKPFIWYFVTNAWLFQLNLYQPLHCLFFPLSRQKYTISFYIKSSVQCRLSQYSMFCVFDFIAVLLHVGYCDNLVMSTTDSKPWNNSWKLKVLDALYKIKRTLIACLAYSLIRQWILKHFYFPNSQKYYYIQKKHKFILKNTKKANSIK